MVQRNRTKSSSSSFHDIDHIRDHKHKQYLQFLLLRCLPLLLLMIFTAASMLRLLSLPAGALFVEEEEDEVRDHSKYSIRTHIPSSKAHQEIKTEAAAATASSPITCSALIDGTSRETVVDDGRAVLCCDRSHHRTDVCYMRGDIRTDPSTSSISVYGPVPEGLSWNSTTGPERIRPYTRKWETGVMNTIDEITLRAVPPSGRAAAAACEVDHEGVPGVVLSTGGYTGNVYHEFNDGLIPLYITTKRFEGEVVLVVLEYHSWWVTKYGTVLEKMSNYKLVDFAKDGRVHCFSELIVGLKIHGELTIDPQLIMPQGSKVGIHDFQALVNQGFGNSMQPQPSKEYCCSPKPKMAIFIRNKSRVILNLREVVRACQRAGFQVQILNPKRTTPLSEIHAVLSSSQAMLAVHGAAVTHFLFMRPGSVLLQIVPLGLDWAADEYYGEPARKLGLEYMEYKVAKHESSLSKEYDSHDPVLLIPRPLQAKDGMRPRRYILKSRMSG
ncbi:hypothetical protein J5N97_000445 [Dioscorea zingiberensis]|uniref:Glycosyltransferase 61 catalytic domain-containing protein n=1 Tax=Dioscorea zingiberensis TaxID=325984 RepID=A0A9D5BSP3_9LILI|nr:hypothetical protein J5N97_000445 [Dioscorea zingiberensis]